MQFFIFPWFFRVNIDLQKSPGSSGRHSRCPAELSEWYFSERNKPFQTFGLWARKFRVSDETKTAKMSKLHAMCIEKHFETKGFFLEKNIILNLFVDLEWTSSSFWRKFSTRVSKWKSTWPVELFEKGFFGRRYNFISSYGSSEEKLNCKKTPVLSGMHSRYPAEVTEGQILEEAKVFKFLGSERESLMLLGKQICQYCQNGSPCDRRSFWSRRVFISKKNFFKSSSRHLVEVFRNLGKNID